MPPDSPSEDAWNPPEGEPDSSSGSLEQQADEELNLARQAVVEGDLRRSAFHVAAALFIDSNNPLALGLLDRLIQASDRPLALAPLQAENWAGLLAVRAHILSRAGDINEALSLIAQLMRATPDHGYERWPLEWLTDDARLARVTARGAAAYLSAIVALFPGNVVDAPADRAQLEQFMPAVDALGRLLRDDAQVMALRSMALRKLGRLAEALQLAQKAWAITPSYAAGTALAVARQVSGDVKGAIEAYRDLLQIEPDDIACRADLAVLCMESGQYPQAARWADEVLAVEPDNEVAAPLRMYLRSRLELDMSAELELRAYAAARPANKTARYGVDLLSPYVAYLPGPIEAIIAAAREVLAQNHGQRPTAFKLSVSALEAPSARLAAEMALGLERNSLVMRVETMPRPDPREPWGVVDYLIWRYEGTIPLPAMAPPPRYVLDEVARLAMTRFRVDRWHAHAGKLAGELGPLALEPLLGVLVHPSPAPQGWASWSWIRHLQFAATMTLAQLDTGWTGSLRRKVLIALLNGPVDWTTAAAIVAATQICFDGPDAARDREVYALLMEFAQRRPSAGPITYLDALFSSMARLPFLPESVRRQWMAMKYEMEKDEASARTASEDH